MRPVNIFVHSARTHAGTVFFQVSWTIGDTTTGLEASTPQAVQDLAQQHPNRIVYYRASRADKWQPINI